MRPLRFSEHAFAKSYSSTFSLKMEELVRLSMIGPHLNEIETARVMKQITKQFGVDKIISFIFDHYLKIKKNLAIKKNPQQKGQNIETKEIQLRG